MLKLIITVKEINGNASIKLEKEEHGESTRHELEVMLGMHNHLCKFLDKFAEFLSKEGMKVVKIVKD